MTVLLGTPATLTGNFDTDGDFVYDTSGGRWYAWDDARINDAHVVSIIAAVT